MSGRLSCRRPTRRQQAHKPLGVSGACELALALPLHKSIPFSCDVVNTSLQLNAERPSLPFESVPRAKGRIHVVRNPKSTLLRTIISATAHLRIGANIVLPEPYGIRAAPILAIISASPPQVG